MPSEDLDFPGSASDIYLSRGTEVNPAQPLMQGDVLDQVELPGLGDDPGKAIILTHPCSMRRGAKLADRLLLARVSVSPPLALEAWATGHIRVMPLPELVAGEAHAASFENVSSVETVNLDGHTRVACLSDHGIALLQQRYVYYLTRVVV